MKNKLITGLLVIGIVMLLVNMYLTTQVKSPIINNYFVEKDYDFTYLNRTMNLTPVINNYTYINETYITQKKTTKPLTSILYVNETNETINLFNSTTNVFNDTTNVFNDTTNVFNETYVNETIYDVNDMHVNNVDELNVTNSTINIDTYNEGGKPHN